MTLIWMRDAGPEGEPGGKHARNLQIGAQKEPEAQPGLWTTATPQPSGKRSMAGAGAVGQGAGQ